MNDSDVGVTLKEWQPGTLESIDHVLADLVNVIGISNSPAQLAA